jgi:hypothetical protein
MLLVQLLLLLALVPIVTLLLPLLAYCALQRFTYRGPNLAMLLGTARAPRLAVISVPGLPENRPGLVTGASCNSMVEKS